MTQNVENDLLEAVLEYYKEITIDDPEELIDDAVEISSNHLRICEDKHIQLVTRYNKLLQDQQDLVKELESVEKEKVMNIKNPNNLKLKSVTGEFLENNIIALEDSIVKLKINKAEKLESLENLQDSIEHYKREFKNKEKIIESLIKDLHRYTEHRNIVQKTMNRHSASINLTTMSGNTSFSLNNTVRGLNSSMIHDPQSSQRTNRSINNSMIVD